MATIQVSKAKLLRDLIKAISEFHSVYSKNPPL